MANDIYRVLRNVVRNPKGAQVARLPELNVPPWLKEILALILALMFLALLYVLKPLIV